MCDCYTDICRICGKDIEMHLGDYETDRGEILVIHEDCLIKGIGFYTQLLLVGIGYHTEQVIDSNFRGKIIIISLTENAWANRHMNNYNGESKIMEEVKHKKKNDKLD